MTAVAALITDSDGQVLLVGRTLPSGLSQVDESPRVAAIRAVADRIGLIPRLGDLLVADWTSGAALSIFDGGEISVSAIRRIPADAHAVFVAPADLPTHTTPADARRIAAALGARADQRAAYLEGGHTPAVLAAMRHYDIAPWVHSGSTWVWHDRLVPAELTIRQAWVWVFAPDGRVVLYVDDSGRIGLPGGTLEAFEHRDPTAAAVREVREETQIDIADPVYLGYVLDRRPRGPVARVRMAATITAIGPSATDPATGTVHRRLLVPPRLIAELCGWGAGADRQTEAAIAAAKTLGIGEPEGAPIEEIPADGSGVLPAA
ncbi:NUDIX hydrolase [Actinokineospora sp.]|uniref:NUDIX hydrolase n=1 Tax=Actinokineospora sp. TaxID=1872133 RepID=UPI0040384755